MPHMSKRIANQLALADIVISNTLANPDIHAAMVPYGYDTARLQEGRQLCENARVHCQRQEGAYGELYAASDALKATRQQVRETYMRHLEIARIVFKGDRAIRKKLGLAAKRKPGMAGWMEQARQFYSQALSEPATLRPLLKFGLAQEILEASQRQLDTVSASDAARWEHKGAARDATIQRDKAVAALEVWLREFLRMARMAFKGRPQLLNKLGITASSQGREARASTTPPVAAPSAALAAPEGQPLSAERRNGHMATANHEA